jgi:[CysO sulfur-carrier protein]-S-L-cysteine hydrolase
MGGIRIPEAIFQGLIEHARRESPLECCGILGGKGETVQRVFELQNVEKSPVRYLMSPQEQLKVFKELERESIEMMAIYHSHPHSIPFPSETDVKMAFYPEVISIIISLKEKNPAVKAFQVCEEAIYPQPIEVIK